MNEQQDRTLRAKMQESAFEELVEDFDQEAIWLNIEPKIAAKKQAKKQNLLLGLWRYAAVLAIGLFLGFYFQNEQQNELLSVHKRILHKGVKDTATKQQLIVQNNTAATPEVKPIVPKKVERRIAKQINDKQQIAESKVIINETPTEKEVLPIAKNKELEVVYFADLEFANTHIAANKPKRNKRKFIQINLPNNNKSSTEEPPIRNLIYALK